jgi:hypothetical protein
MERTFGSPTDAFVLLLRPDGDEEIETDRGVVEWTSKAERDQEPFGCASTGGSGEGPKSDRRNDQPRAGQNVRI